MRIILIMLFLTVFTPAYAYALGWSDLTDPKVLAPILAVLLAVSELLGAIDVIKPNGVVQAIIDTVASLIRKVLGK